MEAKELINRYVHQVGRHLPKQSGPDVSEELLSLLEDALEERASTAGRPADEEIANDVDRVETIAFAGLAMAGLVWVNSLRQRRSAV